MILLFASFHMTNADLIRVLILLILRLNHGSFSESRNLFGVVETRNNSLCLVSVSRTSTFARPGRYMVRITTSNTFHLACFAGWVVLCKKSSPKSAWRRSFSYLGTGVSRKNVARR